MAFTLTSSPKEFIPESQKSEETPLTFICVPPSRRTVLDIQEKIMKSVNELAEIESMELPIADLMDLSLEACVIDWKNMVDGEGQEIVFTKEEFAKFNDMQILLELYTYVKELSEGTEKN